MTFQAAPVDSLQVSGLAGELANDGPVRTQVWNINSTVAGGTNTNTIGSVFTYRGPGEVQVGGSGEFIGILVRPKEYALRGDGSDTLAPTYALQNYESAQFLDMGIIWVELETSASLGDVLSYDVATGAIGTNAVDGATYFAIPNAKLIERDISAPGLAKIQLTN
jgi:hypothetical protein